MTNTISIPVADAKALAEFFEHENPHHLVVRAVFAGKSLRVLLDAPALDEREAFEASFKRRHPQLASHIDLARDEHGQYKYQPASVEWPVWQVSAERYRPAPVPSDTALRRAVLFLSGMDERYTGCNEMKTLRKLIDIAQSHSDMLNPPSPVTMRTVMLAIESANATDFIKGTSNWCAHVAQKLNTGFPEQIKPKGSCAVGELCVCGGDTDGVRAQCDNWVKP